MVYGILPHTCKAKLDNYPHAKIRTEMKKEVKANIYTTTAQVVEPIFSNHFWKHPKRNFSVLDNILRVARRAKSQMVPKNPLNMDFDLGNFFYCTQLNLS
jgi:hypothetical protein